MEISQWLSDGWVWHLVHTFIALRGWIVITLTSRLHLMLSLVQYSGLWPHYLQNEWLMIDLSCTWLFSANEWMFACLLTHETNTGNITPASMQHYYYEPVSMRMWIFNKYGLSEQLVRLNSYYSIFLWILSPVGLCKADISCHIIIIIAFLHSLSHWIKCHSAATLISYSYFQCNVILVGFHHHS